MSAYNFQARFAEDVDAGRKRQTIRAMRKHMPKVGERVHLFTGMRTKKCRRLRAGHEDRHKRVFVVNMTELTITTISPQGVGYCMNQGDLSIETFARNDGFTNWPEMRAWFRSQHGLPFHGFMVEW
jgi:hypothetical protein